MVSNLIKLSPSDVEAAIDVASDIAGYPCLMPATIEPCGRYAWVTTESETDMLTILGVIKDALDCGALPNAPFDPGCHSCGGGDFHYAGCPEIERNSRLRRILQ